MNGEIQLESGVKEEKGGKPEGEPPCDDSENRLVSPSVNQAEEEWPQ